MTSEYFYGSDIYSLLTDKQFHAVLNILYRRPQTNHTVDSLSNQADISRASAEVICSDLIELDVITEENEDADTYYNVNEMSSILQQYHDLSAELLGSLNQIENSERYIKR